LGKDVALKFRNQLPYLFKVLAAAKRLSIQAHPSRAQARTGFEFENNHGIPLNATHRNYKDANHKPECICALSTFWALCGFRSIADILFLVGEVCPKGLGSELNQLKKQTDASGLESFFTKLMSLEPGQKIQVITEASQNAKKRGEQEPAFHWTAKLGAEYPSDIGMLAPLYLNLVRLEPEQALFLPSGELHAYLEGVGIELMANSDNVLRGGLTPKHIDVPELLKVLNFRSRRIELLAPKNLDKSEKVYTSLAEEFILSVITISNDDMYHKSNLHSAEILLCTEGEAQLENNGRDHSVYIKRGDSAIVFAAAGSYRIRGNAVLFKAAVPPLN
jgi:mannose-6-phosphate isomerase